ncbi:MAG: hypothetical protein WCP46_04075 [Alphaproteobacteria bacterium]
MAKEYKDYSAFEGGSASSVGGATGSVRIEAADGHYYQLKKSILDASFARRAKSGLTTPTDRENFGEMIASVIGRALSNSNSGLELVPDVSLVYDQKKKRVLIASRYLKGVVGGDLDKYARKERNVKSKRKIIKVTAKAEKEDELFIGGSQDKQIKKDVCYEIALSAIVGDHDVNPANLVVVKSSSGALRVARIDFGHAFNDLLRFGSIVGGGVKNKENQVLDFLNRRAVAHFNPNRQRSKLWKFYKGIVPSLEMAEALREVAGAPDLQNGIKQAKASFESLIADLSKDTTANARVIDHIKQSLVAISNNIGLTAISVELHPMLVVDKVFKNIEAFCKENQKKMMDVAMLMEMQANLDKMILDKSQGMPINQKKIEEVVFQYIVLQTKEGIALSNERGIRWVKTDEKISAFKGDIQGYIKHRSKILGCDSSLNKDFSFEERPLLVSAGAKSMTTVKQLSLVERLIEDFKEILIRIKILFGFVEKPKQLSNITSPTPPTTPQSDILQKSPVLTQSAADKILKDNKISKPVNVADTKQQPKLNIKLQKKVRTE